MLPPSSPQISHTKELSFKLGHYSSASNYNAYGLAINIFPQVCLLPLPLHTNRLLVRLKIGEYSNSLEICWRASGVITPGDILRILDLEATVFVSEGHDRDCTPACC